MEKTFSQRSDEKPQKLAIDWAESDWFKVWLRLARHESTGNPQDEQRDPVGLAHAA